MKGIFFGRKWLAHRVKWNAGNHRFRNGWEPKTATWQNHAIGIVARIILLLILDPTLTTLTLLTLTTHVGAALWLWL